MKVFSDPQQQQQLAALNRPDREEDPISGDGDPPKGLNQTRGYFKLSENLQGQTEAPASPRKCAVSL